DVFLNKVGDTPGPWAADLVEKDVAGGPDQRGAGWVVVEALGVRSLIVAAGGSLRLKERGGVAPDVGAAEARGQCIGVVAPAVEEVHTARVGGAAEHVEPWCVEIPIHRGGDEADGGIAVTQVALQPPHEVIRERLHLVAVRGTGRAGRRRPLACGHGVEHADGPTVCPFAAEFGRAENGAARRHVDEVVGRGGRSFGGPSDAARVEVLGSVGELREPPSVAPEAEDLSSLDEEGPPLLELYLEGGEVDDRGIELDLPEIGVDGRVEREVRADAVLEIGTHAAEIRAPSVEGVLRG